MCWWRGVINVVFSPCSRTLRPQKKSTSSKQREWNEKLQHLIWKQKLTFWDPVLYANCISSGLLIYVFLHFFWSIILSKPQHLFLSCVPTRQKVFLLDVHLSSSSQTRFCSSHALNICKKQASSSKAGGFSITDGLSLRLNCKADTVIILNKGVSHFPPLIGF
jgi:hypothetical protein